MFTAAQTAASLKPQGTTLPIVEEKKVVDPATQAYTAPRPDPYSPAPAMVQPTGWLNQQVPSWTDIFTGYGGGYYPVNQARPTWSELLSAPELQLMAAGLGGSALSMLPKAAGATASAASKGVPVAAQAAAKAAQAAPVAQRAGQSVLNWMKAHKMATGVLGTLSGGLAYGNIAGASPTESGPMGASGTNTSWLTGYLGETGMPEPGSTEYTGEPFGNPTVVDVGGQKFWWDGTTWQLIPTGSQGLTPEQQMAEAEKDRQAALARVLAGLQGQLTPEQQLAEAEAERENQERLIRMQYEYQMQQLVRQLEMERQAQSASAAQSMANMYAADPYKYWAQLGTPTPEAVARLTGGRIAPGEQFGQVPMSIPSSQWWGNLLPSEQEQIMGGINWLGVDPYDYLAMYQRMIPGLASRQVEPMWAR